MQFRVRTLHNKFQVHILSGERIYVSTWENIRTILSQKARIPIPIIQYSFIKFEINKQAVSGMFM